MATDMQSWTRFVRKQRRFTAQNSFYNEPQITHSVSKTFKGHHKQDLLGTTCADPEAMMHLHFPGSFECNSLESADCDSNYSRMNLTGSVKSGYQATFGHDEDNGEQQARFKERGYFFGGFRLLQNDVVILKGVIDGMCNTGVIHDPLQEPCEKCHQVGRWHGRIHGTVRLPNNERGFLIGSIGIDLKYDRTPSYLATEFIGTLEGMLIRQCKRAG